MNASVEIVEGQGTSVQGKRILDQVKIDFGIADDLRISGVEFYDRYTPYSYQSEKRKANDQRQNYRKSEGALQILSVICPVEL